jgi:hypothetical protein
MKIIAGILTLTISAMLLLVTCSPADTPVPTDKTEVNVSKVSLDKTALSLAVDDFETLTATVMPSNATNKEVSWSSSSSAIARVNSEGKVTAVKIGTATITVETREGGFTETCEVTVTSTVTGVKLDKTELSIDAEDQATLTATVMPADATNKAVTWSSSNESVVRINVNGIITAIKIGTATITCTTGDGAKTATCAVTVSEADPDNLLRAMHITDPAFLDYCRSQMRTWDKNKDGKLYADEAAAVGSLGVPNTTGNAIKSLKGIEYFTGIKYLDCSLNNLTSLDLSNNPALTELYCSNNHLTSLDVSNCYSLGILHCFGNQLGSLDLAHCPRLRELSCYYNELTSLDLSACTILTTLDIGTNRIASLDLSNNKKLRGLRYDNNGLTELDVSACTEMTSLHCYKNNLTELDLSKNIELMELNCEYNQLASLDVSLNNELETLMCNGNLLNSIILNKNNDNLRLIHCGSNSMSASAFNATFETLPYSGKIHIYDNPGTHTCDTSIATKKNWTVTVE